MNIIFLGTSKVTWELFLNELILWFMSFSVKLTGNEIWIPLMGGHVTPNLANISLGNHKKTGLVTAL